MLKNKEVLQSQIDDVDQRVDKEGVPGDAGYGGRFDSIPGGPLTRTR